MKNQTKTPTKTKPKAKQKSTHTHIHKRTHTHRDTHTPKKKPFKKKKEKENKEGNQIQVPSQRSWSLVKANEIQSCHQGDLPSAPPVCPASLLSRPQITLITGEPETCSHISILHLCVSSTFSRVLSGSTERFSLFPVAHPSLLPNACRAAQARHTLLRKAPEHHLGAIFYLLLAFSASLTPL